MARRPRPSLTEREVRRHHEIMSARPHASAYDHLRNSFAERNYDLRALNGVIEGVAVWDQHNRYLFAWQVKPHHLLFYVRSPALSVEGQLHAMAETHHPGRVTTNPSGETKINLQAGAEAETLMRWLLPKLPLPAIPRQRKRGGA
jgi:hypothetical protein